MIPVLGSECGLTANAPTDGPISSTHSRNTLLPKVSRDTSELSSWVISVVSATTRTATHGIRASTAISTCMDGHLTGSPRYSTTKPKRKVSRLSWYRNEIRRSRVRFVKPTDGYQRVERGLYVCDECEMAMNADVNGAENIRRKVTPSLVCDGGDRSTGWLAQPAVHLFDRSEGSFAPREQVVNREP